MKLDFYEMIFSIAIPFLFGLMAIYFLTIGLRGILTKQPFLVSNKWFFSIMFVILFPMVFLPLSLSSLPGGFDIINWVHPLMIGVILVTMCYQLKGYTAYAVTDTSFREALLAALQKLQLPYEESLSVIRLTSIDANLQVAVLTWTGAGIIRVKRRAHQPVLKQVVDGMNEYFRNTSVPTKMMPCVLYLVTGGIMVLVAIGMFFIGRNFGTI